MKEAELNLEDLPNVDGLLEKKWSSIIRLQKKVDSIDRDIEFGGGVD
jgi:hypothetical protein